MKTGTLLVTAFLAAMFAAEGASAQSLDTIRVASGLTLPLWVTAPPGDYNRLFILEQRSGSTGRVRILDLTTNPPTLLATPYLSISPVATGNEQGLLGLAFHPNFLNNGYFWVDYTNSAGTTIIARYQANPPYATSTTANAASATTVLSIAQPFTNHNGGWIAFAPNDTQGYLHISMGDGGSAGDPSNNAQNVNSLLGKLLRIDVDGADNVPGNDDDDGVMGMTLPPYTNPSTNPFFGPTAGLDEIWAWGLRNPWRCSFDRMTRELYIADVGQNAIEEIDFQPADVNGSMGGRNYGWRCYEGNSAYNTAGCGPAGNYVSPIYTYTHAGGACSVTGGYVYRGPAIPALQGTYFFADYCSAQIFSFRYSISGGITEFTDRTSDLAPGGGLSISTITSFGEDAAGEMYIVDRGGEVFKIVPLAPANNACANATSIGDGATQFTTASATTDGPDEPSLCNFNGYSQIGSDVWFRYTATCTGHVTVSLCGANFNAKMAIYPACPTGSGQALACNDDSCGTSPRITFAATSGASYTIRVGGVNAVTGSGTINISCVAPPDCPADIDDNGYVNIDDLFAVINSWGPCGGCPADISPPGGNGFVNIDDLFAVINSWGQCTP